MKYCANDACPDLARFGRRGEYLDRIEKCPQCGQALRPGEAPPEAEAVGPAGDEATGGAWVCVRTFEQNHAADLARMQLEALGIPCFLLGQHFASIRTGSTSTLEAIRLCVPAEHAAAARDALGR